MFLSIIYLDDFVFVRQLWTQDFTINVWCVIYSFLVIVMSRMLPKMWKAQIEIKFQQACL